MPMVTTPTSTAAVAYPDPAPARRGPSGVCVAGVVRIVAVAPSVAAVGRALGLVVRRGMDRLAVDGQLVDPTNLGGVVLRRRPTFSGMDVSLILISEI
ncbi:hypothetical protein JCM24511_02987 [Saitozyma sp. JCM 24511]|nr:hypothetical protein JCM24511_02987 [Saitozyma sp. JCM 24511]